MVFVTRAKSLFTCPICSAPLTREGQSYTCPGGHSYDRAKEGYVHLLPANRLHSKAPGDDRDMAAARTRFLSGGHYAHLCAALQTLALGYTGSGAAVLDSGCGEGYYTAAVHTALTKAGRTPRTAGVDLSKPSLKLAARRTAACEFAVASVYHLPVGDGQVDLLLNCFSPMAVEEFSRVLKPGGVLLYVVPGPDHLWELKEVLYDKPYRNGEERVEYPGFSYLDVVSASRTLDLDGDTLQDLFRMTPYFWKTPKAGGERLAALPSLSVQADFRIHAFRRL